MKNGKFWTFIKCISKCIQFCYIFFYISSSQKCCYCSLHTVSICQCIGHKFQTLAGTNISEIPSWYKCNLNKIDPFFKQKYINCASFAFIKKEEKSRKDQTRQLPTVLRCRKAERSEQVAVCTVLSMHQK